MKKNYSNKRKPYASEIEDRIIELHQHDKIGAQAIADKLTEEFEGNFYPCAGKLYLALSQYLLLYWDSHSSTQ